MKSLEHAHSKELFKKYIEDVIAEEIINKRITDNDVINLDIKEDKIVII